MKNISSVSEYVDGTGRQVVVHTVEFSDSDGANGSKRYFGACTLVFKHPQTGQPMPRPFEFPFPSNVVDVKDAFAKFDLICGSEFEAQRKACEEEKRGQLIVPSGSNSQLIL